MKKLSIYNQVISCVFFSLLGLQVKYLLDITNIESIVFFRSFIGLVLILILSTTLKKGIKIVKTSNIKIHILNDNDKRDPQNIFQQYYKIYSVRIELVAKH